MEKKMPEIDEAKAEKLLDRLVALIYSGHSLQDAVAMFSELVLAEDLEEAIRRYRKETHQDGGRIICGTEVDRWYAGSRDDDGHWPRVREFLLDPSGKNWDTDTVTAIDEASTEVVAHLHDPSRSSFGTRGLVVGHVQSGKTANFTAVLSKAADCNFRLLIVLSGLTNSLRQQTQERLENDLIGGRTHLWHKLTGAEADYSDIPIRLESLIHSKDQRSLAVIKKNAHRLRRLRDDLLRPDVQLQLKDCPVLIIDDECDQASVNSRTNPHADPTTINRLLREILGCLPRVSYVGYTATPFANVLINPDPDLEDMYPRDFIIPLEAPPAYFGAERIFGRDILLGDHDEEQDGLDVIRTIADSEVASLSPPPRTSYRDFEPAVVDSLEDSVRYFICATACRVLRDQDHKHSSMLVHTDWHGVVHERMSSRIREFLDEVQQRWDAGDPGEQSRFSSLWGRECTRVPDPTGAGRITESWPEIEPLISGVLRAVTMHIENCESDTRVQFADEVKGTSGLKSIIVGGNILARGLTVEGLVVSYFTRHARQDDSLMQMGRWFGYRVGYEELPRIWMTDDLRDDFHHLARQEAEFRLELEHYAEQGSTPLDLQPRVRTHPNRLPTSKMGASRTVARAFAGDHLQTFKYHVHDAGWLSRNWEAGNHLLESCGHPDRENGPHVIFESVEVRHVIEFLGKYSIHEKHAAFSNKFLADYIEREIRHAELHPGDDRIRHWNVVRVGHGSGVSSTRELGTGSVSMINRSRKPEPAGDTADIGALMSKQDLLIDLQVDSRPDNWAAIKALREGQGAPPLLLLYPIDPSSKRPDDPRSKREDLGAVHEVLGVALYFPDHDHVGEYVQAPPPPEAIPDDEAISDDVVVIADRNLE